jgi:hypothetical protein
VANAIISSSSSIVTVPICDDTQAPVQFQTNVNQAPVTIVGFLQIFINSVDANDNPNVTVLNVAGCSNTTISSTPTISGSSPRAGPFDYTPIAARKKYRSSRGSQVKDR